VNLAVVTIVAQQVDQLPDPPECCPWRLIWTKKSRYASRPFSGARTKFTLNQMIIPR